MCSKVMALNIKKSPLFEPYFPHLYHVTCFVGFISFWTLVLNAKLHRPFQYAIGISTVYVLIILQSCLLRAYVSVHKFDIICFSETYLDSNNNDKSLEISGYYLICSDHSSNKKGGGIRIYYKNFLPLKVTGVCLLEEYITFDLIMNNKLYSFVALYRSPSQSKDDFATFSVNFEMTLDLVSKKNPILLVVLGDFKAKLRQWHDKFQFQLKISLRSLDYIR